MKILIADPISKRGVELLRANKAFQVDENVGLKEDALCEIIGGYDALIVRSQTKVNKRVIEAAKKLRVVGRAGVGVDNVDVDAATRRGIIVMNTPGGNTISTAEHTFCDDDGAGPQYPAGPHVDEGGEVGPQIF